MNHTIKTFPAKMDVPHAVEQEMDVSGTDYICPMKVKVEEHEVDVEHCDESFTEGSKLVTHIQNHSSDDHTWKKPYKCSICSKCFKTIAARSVHHQGH